MTMDTTLLSNKNIQTSIPADTLENIVRNTDNLFSTSFEEILSDYLENDTLPKEEEELPKEDVQNFILDPTYFNQIKSEFEKMDTSYNVNEEEKKELLDILENFEGFKNFNDYKEHKENNISKANICNNNILDANDFEEKLSKSIKDHIDDDNIDILDQHNNQNHTSYTNDIIQGINSKDNIDISDECNSERYPNDTTQEINSKDIVTNTHTSQVITTIKDSDNIINNMKFRISPPLQKNPNKVKTVIEDNEADSSNLQQQEENTNASANQILQNNININNDTNITNFSEINRLQQIQFPHSNEFFYNKYTSIETHNADALNQETQISTEEQFKTDIVDIVDNNSDTQLKINFDIINEDANTELEISFNSNNSVEVIFKTEHQIGLLNSSMYLIRHILQDFGFDNISIKQENNARKDEKSFNKSNFEQNITTINTNESNIHSKLLDKKVFRYI